MSLNLKLKCNASITLKLSVIFLFIFCCNSLELIAQDKPNVVVIFADDLGYGDVGAYGATKLETPNIDRLAREGRMFTDAHSASAVCTPSRYALLTGRYPFRAQRIRVRGKSGAKGSWGPLPRNHKLIIDPEDFTIADLMKQRGYATAAIGKWHLGFGEQTPTNWNKPLTPGPLQVGFDYYFGVPFVNSGPPYVYVENESVLGADPDDPLEHQGKPVSPTPKYPDKSPNTFSGGMKAHSLYKDKEIGMTLARKSVNWIKTQSQQEQPFFLYLSTTNIHHPFTPHEYFQGTSESGRYGDFVHELDWIVGEVLNALDDTGEAENTLIIFTSDNGGMLNVGGQEAWRAGHRINGELLGFKFDVWEGGHRVPFIARWPGKTEPNTTSDQLLSNIDLFATLAAMAGYDLEKHEAPDSYNMLPALTEENLQKPIRDHLVIAPRRPENLGIRWGEWMYIGAKGGGGWTGGEPGDHILGGPAALQFAGQKNSDIKDGRFKSDIPDEQLYNLNLDLSQSTNLIEDKPELGDKLRRMLRYIRQETEATRDNNLEIDQ